MGQLILENVIQVLRDAGYAVEWGFPQGKIPDIGGPVCAVNLLSADLTQRKTKVLVRVISPVEQGAAVCEQAAMDIGERLREQGWQCGISACGYDSRVGLFSVEVTAEYAEEQPVITVAGSERRYAQAFSAWKKLDSSTTEWGLAQWNFQLEEWVPVDKTEQLFPEGTFTLVHTTAHGEETFTDAAWTYQKREWESGGIRVIRMGVAADRSFETIE